MRIQPTTTKALFLAISIFVSGMASATHEGTWHGNGDPLSTSFCADAGDLLGSGVEGICIALFA